MSTTVLDETTVAETADLLIPLDAPNVPEAPPTEAALPSRAPADRTDCGPYAAVLCCGFDNRTT